MAIFHLRLTALSRANGVNAIQLAARYAATVLANVGSGEVYDFRGEAGVVHQEIIVPEGCESPWQDRQNLWNAAELCENRKDARVAREYQIGLPYELLANDRIQLARC